MCSPMKFALLPEMNHLIYIYYVCKQALILLLNRTNRVRLVHRYQCSVVHTNVALQLTSSQWQKQ